jgi:hypothetical protein
VAAVRVTIPEELEVRLRALVGPRGGTKFVLRVLEEALDLEERGPAPLVSLPRPVPGAGKVQRFGPEGGTLLMQGPPPGASSGVIPPGPVGEAGDDAVGGVGVPRPEGAGRLWDATYDKLAANSQERTYLGELALRTAWLLETSKAVQGYAVLVKELRATMAQALGDMPEEEDELTRLLKEKGDGA